MISEVCYKGLVLFDVYCLFCYVIDSGEFYWYYSDVFGIDDCWFDDLRIWLVIYDEIVVDCVLFVMGFIGVWLGGLLIDDFIVLVLLFCVCCGYLIVDIELCWYFCVYVIGLLVELEFGFVL